MLIPPPTRKRSGRPLSDNDVIIFFFLGSAAVTSPGNYVSDSALFTTSCRRNYLDLPQTEGIGHGSSFEFIETVRIDLFLV